MSTSTRKGVKHGTPIEQVDINRKEELGGDAAHRLRPFPSKEEWDGYIEAEGLTDALCDDWHRLHENGWVDGDGKPISDWKRYLRAIDARVRASYEVPGGHTSPRPLDTHSTMTRDEYAALTGSCPF